jgi:hypothetical protein
VPIRSNIYQRLVAAVHEQIGPSWTVTESRLLTDSRTGQLREVDVVIDGTAAGYPMLIGVEARDRRRVADVTWVESMAKKHDDLPTDKLVLWSPTRFSKSAAVKAKALGIVTVTSKTLADAPWATMAREFSGGSMKWVQPAFELFVDVCLPSGEAARWPASRDTILRQSSDGAQTTLGSILSFVTQSNEVRAAMLDHAPQGGADLHGIFEPAQECEVIDFNGRVARLQRVVIGIRTSTETLPVDLHTIVHENVATSLAELKAHDGIVRVLVREALDGKRSVEVTHAKPAESRPRPNGR